MLDQAPTQYALRASNHFHLLTLTHCNKQERRKVCHSCMMRCAPRRYITNHGIPQEDIDGAFAANLARERLPMEIKLKQQSAVDKSNQVLLIRCSLYV